MLTFRELSEKKSKIKINPKQADLTEKDKKNKEVSCESVDLTEEWINASIEVSADYFFAEGINEDGLDQIIDEVGLEDFVDFVIDPIEELNEERSARKASVKAPSYEKVKAAVDKTDAAKKKAGKGEYSKSYAKRSGETEDSTDYKEKAPAKKKAKPVAKATVRKPKAAPKKKAKPVAKATVRKPKAAPKKKAATVKKVEKAVKTAKKTQPQKPTSKKGLLGKVGDAVKKGVERHNKARAAGKVPEKRVKEFAKGFKKGVSGTLKFAGKVKKAVSEETQVDEGVYEKQKTKEVMGALKKRDLKKGVKKKIAADIVKKKGDTSKSDDRYAYEETITSETNLLTFNELNRYGKETGKATGSVNKREGSPVKKGGNRKDLALLAVRNMIRRETGKPEGQRKKTKGEKGKRQIGDRKFSPADTIAKRRQSKKDAEKLMRDTSGT